MLDHTCELAVLCNRNCFKILCTLLNNPSQTDKQSEVLWKENCVLSCLWSPCLIGQIFGYHSHSFELCKGHLNPNILQFFLIWVECILKVLLKSPSFFSIQDHFDTRNYTWRFTSSAILIPPSLLWCHEWYLCPSEVKNHFGTLTSMCVV